MNPTTPDPNNPGQLLQAAIKNSGVKVVTCSVCGTRHEASSTSFYTIYGDIHNGVWSPIVGGNYTQEMVGVDRQFTLQKVTIVCKGNSPQQSCLWRLLYGEKT